MTNLTRGQLIAGQIKAHPELDEQQIADMVDMNIAAALRKAGFEAEHELEKHVDTSTGALERLLSELERACPGCNVQGHKGITARYCYDNQRMQFGTIDKPCAWCELTQAARTELESSKRSDSVMSTPAQSKQHYAI